MIKRCFKTINQPLVVKVCLQTEHTFLTCFSRLGLFPVDSDNGICFLLLLKHFMKRIEFSLGFHTLQEVLTHQVAPAE